MSEAIQREAMEYDVVIVGAGPSGLSAAIRLKQLNPDITVAVLEKGAEVGAHILSGAVIDPKGLTELLPNWKELGAPLETAVTKDQFILLGPQGSLSLPMWAMPPYMNNHGNYIASLGNVCRWLAGQAEALGANVRRGEQGSLSVYYSSFKKTESDPVTGAETERSIRFLRHYIVFNADQIDGAL